MLRLFSIVALPAAVAGCASAPPYGYSDPAYGAGYYTPGPGIGVGAGGGSTGGAVGAGIGVGF